MGLFPFWNNSNADELSDEIRNTLLSKFDVQSEAADRMRYVSKRGKYAGKPTTLLCVFEPASTENGKSLNRKYDELMAAQKDVLYSGHMIQPTSESGGKLIVYLEDRRNV